MMFSTLTNSYFRTADGPCTVWQYSHRVSSVGCVSTWYLLFYISINMWYFIQDAFFFLLMMKTSYNTYGWQIKCATCSRVREESSWKKSCDIPQWQQAIVTFLWKKVHPAAGAVTFVDLSSVGASFAPSSVWKSRADIVRSNLITWQ